MASKKDKSGNGGSNVAETKEDLDPSLMEGLDQWDESEGEVIVVKRMFFKPLEAGPGAVLRGYPVGLVPITSIHDGKSVEGTGIVVATTRPARLTNAAGETKVYPAGTLALLYCTDELQEIKVIATGKRCVEFAFRMNERIRTNAGRTFQPMEFMRFAGSKTREEVKQLTLSPTVRALWNDLGLGDNALTEGDKKPANPTLPQ